MIILIKYVKLITTYSMLYDTCDYHILHYSKLIIVHQGWGQVQYLYLVLVLKYKFIST